MKNLAILIVCNFALMAGVACAGVLKGTVTYQSDAPVRKAIQVTKDQHCIHNLQDGKSESLVVSKERGIKNVVVYLRARKATVTVPKKNPVMDQVNCMYYPHVLVVTKGTTVDMTSSDPVAHNVHSHATKNEAPNWQIPGPGKVLPLKLEKREPIKFTCDIHTWMRGYIFVADNDYFSVTGYKDEEGKWMSADVYEASSDKGTYAIEDVPSGKYRVQAWHEELGTTKAKTLQIPASGEVEIDFTSADFKKKGVK